MISRQVKYWNTVLIPPIGIVASLFLVFMITFYSSKALESYKKVLYLSVFVDFCFCTITWLFNVTNTTVDGYYLIILDGLLGQLSQMATLVFSTAWLIFIYWCLTVLPVQFIYRLVLLFFDIKMNIFVFLGLIVLSLAPIVEYLRFTVIAVVTMTEAEKVNCTHYVRQVGWDNNGSQDFSCIPLAKLAGNEFKPFLTVVVSYGIIIVCAVAIFFKLRQLEKRVGEKNSVHQRQISIVLTIESLVPLVDIVLPIVFDLLGAFVPSIQDSINPFRELAFVFAIYGPCINPVVKLTVISNYRNGIRKIFKKFFSKQSNSVTVVSSHNG